MQDDCLYLRDNVKVEPLIDSWYAWSHLIPPLTLARNMTERHFKIMESFISAPESHAIAVKDPKMLGGPFIDYGTSRVSEIKALYEKTKGTRGDLIELSSAVSSLDLLLSSAKGFSLEPLYPKVPSRLRGYVELVYDRNNNASFRLLESLIYRSPYYKRDAQSVTLSLIDNDDRPFVLSTPRLNCEGSVNVPIPFDDELVDGLFRTKMRPNSWTEISRRIEGSSDRSALLRPFFTSEAPKPYTAYAGSGVRWRYFGHACILIETKGFSILFDPVLSYTYESQVSRYTYKDLPDRIDLVVITHNHQDHILFETLLQIRHKVGAVVVPPSGTGWLEDPSVKLLLESVGFTNVLELDELQTIDLSEDVNITGIPFFGEHSDLAIRSKMAYLVRLGTRSLLFLADSCNIEPELYKLIHQQVGDIDALFLGMECEGAPLSWLYGPLLSRGIQRAMDSSRRLSGSNYEQAIDIVNRFHCSNVYVYAMGQEPWLKYIMSIKYTNDSKPIIESNRLIQECVTRGIVAERLFGEKEMFL